MKRKDFLRNALMGTGIMAATGVGASVLKNEIDELQSLDIVGFNHLPNPSTEKMDNMVLHRAHTRGSADHGWLQANHSFSFASYYNPERMHFGVLRVLNDDTVAEGRGFGTHPHDNMEIITIPFEGDLSHKDSMGNSSVIRSGEIQVMSAGTGIQHSEFNHRQDSKVRLFQIWLFPNKQGVTPRYQQMQYDLSATPNTFQQLLSPHADDAGVWIHQNAWFNMGQFTQATQTTYTLQQPQSNGVYAMIVEGEAVINGQSLQKRDALGVWSVEKLDIQAAAGAKILLLEVPMQLN